MSTSIRWPRISMRKRSRVQPRMQRRLAVKIAQAAETRDLLEHFDWNSIFVLNLPVVAVCLVAAWILVPESRDPAKPHVDVVGTALSIAGLSAIVWGLIEAPDRGWGEPVILGAFAAGAAIVAAFIAWEHYSKHPMLDVSVFRNLRFSAASVSIAFVFWRSWASCTSSRRTCRRSSATRRSRPGSGCCRSPSA